MELSISPLLITGALSDFIVLNYATIYFENNAQIWRYPPCRNGRLLLGFVGFKWVPAIGPMLFFNSSVASQAAQIERRMARLFMAIQ